MISCSAYPPYLCSRKENELCQNTNITKKVARMNITSITNITITTIIMWLPIMGK